MEYVGWTHQKLPERRLIKFISPKNIEITYNNKKLYYVCYIETVF